MQQTKLHSPPMLQPQHDKEQLQKTLLNLNQDEDKNAATWLSPFLRFLMIQNLTANKN